MLGGGWWLCHDGSSVQLVVVGEGKKGVSKVIRPGKQERTALGIMAYGSSGAIHEKLSVHLGCKVIL